MEVKKEQLQRALKVLKEVVSKQKKGSDEIFETTDKLNLLFSLIKVFPGKGKILKIQLPHKPHSSGVCMFVADVDRTSRDYQTTIATYEKFLSDHHVSQQIDIMPLKRVKLEHSEFEKKRSLSNFYDVFLCDARIIHLMPEILGKHFIGRKKFLIQVRLDSKDLKDEVDKALKTTTCAIKNRGASSMVTFGDMTLSEDQLLDNLQQVLDILMKEVKGGWSNIRSMVLKGSQSIAVPLYQSHAPKDSVKVEKKMREASSNVVKQKIPGLKGKYDVTKAEEVSTVRNAKVLVTEAGDIILLANKKEKKGKDMVEEEKELDEIDDDDDEEEEEEDDDDEIDYELVRNKKKRVLKEKKKKTNKKVKLDLNPEDDNKKTKDNKNAKDTKNKSKNPKKTNESSPRGPKVLVRRTRYNMVYSSGRIGHTGVKKRPVMRKKVKLVKKGGGGVKRRSGKITSKYGGTNSGESKKENGTEVIKSKSESSGGVEKLGDKKKNNNKNKPNKSVKNTENIKKMGEKSNNKNNSSKKKIDKKNMKNNNDNKKNNKDNNDNKKIKNKNNKDNNMHNKKNTTKVSKKKAKKEDGLQNESTPAKKKIKINQ